MFKRSAFWLDIWHPDENMACVVYSTRGNILPTLILTSLRLYYGLTPISNSISLVITFLKEWHLNQPMAWQIFLLLWNFLWLLCTVFYVSYLYKFIRSVTPPQLIIKCLEQLALLLWSGQILRRDPGFESLYRDRLYWGFLWFTSFLPGKSQVSALK